MKANDPGEWEWMMDQLRLYNPRGAVLAERARAAGLLVRVEHAGWSVDVSNPADVTVALDQDDKQPPA